MRHPADIRAIATVAAATAILPLAGNGAADSAISFVECPKCEKRMRIDDDGTKAYVNKCRVPEAERPAMAERAKRFLELAKPVAPANPEAPLMGWSSWNTFGVGISEEIILGVAKAMATNGLKAAGYVYVNIDDGFFDGHGPDGVLRFHPERFPRGMKGTVDGIHALGMKAGTYSDAGDNTCGSLGGDKGGLGAGLYGHDAADCDLHFNKLGFDFIKVDYCGARRLKLDERERYTEISKAIHATGRDVRFNICRWAFPGTWAAEVAGSWRTTGDIRARWSSVRGIIEKNLYLSPYALPGHFNDLDMLEAGMRAGKVKSAFGKSDPGLTFDEEVTHFGMWCMMSSPLVLGNDVRNMPSESLRLVTNPFLLRMNQDVAAPHGYVAARHGNAYVFARDAFVRFGKSRWVAVCNMGDAVAEVPLKARDLDLGGRIDAFDLVERGDVGSFEDMVFVKLEPHASRFFLLDAEERLDRELYEAETAYLREFNAIGRNQGKAAFAKSREGASGGACVFYLGASPTNDLVWKNVKVSREGTYSLSFRYATPDARRFNVEIDGGGAVALEAPVPSGRFSGWGEVSMRARLAPGVHTVRLYNAEDYAPDIDRMVLKHID